MVAMEKETGSGRDSRLFSFVVWSMKLFFAPEPQSGPQGAREAEEKTRHQGHPGSHQGVFGGDYSRSKLVMWIVCST